MFASRLPATILCLVALAASAALVGWTAGRQAANGSASLTAAARRLLADDTAPGVEAVLVKVAVEHGGRRGHTEAQVGGFVGRGRVAIERIVSQWERPEGGDWQVVGTPRRR